MRVVRDPAALADAVTSARREAESAFGDGTLLLERYLEGPRHIEVQVMADTHGHVVHCFERECSIQRRHQKVIEEAPSLAVDAALRARLGDIAVRAARTVGYVGAGTVELILDAAGDVFFLEMNTRLQVEHPVTEAITGLDLVRLQIEVAEGSPLPFAQDALAIDGHAIEARLYAEDAAHDFLPVTGRVRLWAPLAVPGVRWDSGVETGTDVPVHYDSMLAKIIAHAPTRTEATARLVRALEGLGVAGLETNRDFLLATLRHPAFEAGDIDTHFVERHLPPAARRRAPDTTADVLHAVAAAIWAHERRRAVPGPIPPSIPSGWRNVRWRPQRATYRVRDHELAVAYVAGPGGRFDVEVGVGDEKHAAAVRLAAIGDQSLALEVDGVRRRFAVVEDADGLVLHGALGTAELTELPRFPPARADAVAGGCAAPMTGVVRDVRVAVGDRVGAGAVLIVLEAMKMEHEITALADGVVSEVRVEIGQMVDPDVVLIVVEASAEPGAAAST
jgi:acetyl/propionyl-CoA carboxylase alpha subunit